MGENTETPLPNCKMETEKEREVVTGKMNPNPSPERFHVIIVIHTLTNLFPVFKWTKTHTAEINKGNPILKQFK